MIVCRGCGKERVPGGDKKAISQASKRDLCPSCVKKEAKKHVWMPVIKPYLAQDNLPEFQKVKANFKCPNCLEVRNVLVISWYRKFKVQAEGVKGWCHKCICKTEEHGNKVSEALTGLPGRPVSETAKKKLSKAHLALWEKPEFRERRTKQLHDMWQDPSFKARHYAASNTEEVKQKRQVSWAVVWKDPMLVEHQSQKLKEAWKRGRVQWLESLRTPEYIAKRKIIAKKLLENPKYRKALAERLACSRSPQRAAERFALTTEEIEKISSKFQYSGFKNNRHILTCLKCSFVSLRKKQRYLRDCQACYDQRTCKTENTIKDWIVSLGFEARRIRVDRKEIDIYLEEQNLGIEYCGLYWHNEDSPEPRLKGYHLSKMLLAKSVGARLITIFEDEWLERQSQVKGFLLSVLGINSLKIPARKCTVEPLEKIEALEFLKAHHIQGPASGSLYLGLVYDTDLVGVIVGGAHHRGRDGLVLKRLCFKGGVTVMGGASKLFEAFKQNASSQGHKLIISWSDNRWSEGGIYNTLGFQLEKDSEPDYQYVRRSKRYSKQSLRKTAEEVVTGRTELELRREQGYSRIWDCGKKTWIFRL